MATPPSADTVDTVPSIVKVALTPTTHDSNVAVATPLGTRLNLYRPSKPTNYLGNRGC